MPLSKSDRADDFGGSAVISNSFRKGEPTIDSRVIVQRTSI